MVHDLDEARVIILQKREEATRKTQEAAAVKDAEQKSEESAAAQATEQKSEESAAAKDTGPKSEEPAVKGAEPKSEKKPDADQKPGQGNPPQ
jgi:hypothetical protein